MRHVCTECGAEIADGAETKFLLRPGDWRECGTLYNTRQTEHPREDSHQHITCLTRERWYIVCSDNYIDGPFDARPAMTNGIRAIRVSEEYLAEATITPKQLWPEE